MNTLIYIVTWMTFFAGALLFVASKTAFVETTGAILFGSALVALTVRYTVADYFKALEKKINHQDSPHMEALRMADKNKVNKF